MISEKSRLLKKKEKSRVEDKINSYVKSFNCFFPFFPSFAIENDSESKSKNVEGTTRWSGLEPGTQYDLETISSVWRYDKLSNLEIFYYSDI